VFYRAKIVFISALVCGASLQGCATYTPPPPPTFSWGQSIDFEGLSFSFKSVENSTYYKNWIGHVTYAGDNFVTIELTMVNRTGMPLPTHLQPIFRLIDKSGAVYESSLSHTIAINMGKPGRPSPGMNMNPNITVTQEIVFEAPRQSTYQVQAIIPNRARMGFDGSVTSSGPYFLMDISSQL